MHMKRYIGIKKGLGGNFGDIWEERKYDGCFQHVHRIIGKDSVKHDVQNGYLLEFDPHKPLSYSDLISLSYKEKTAV